MTNTLTADLTRPIVGIENRTAQEVFDIMSDRIKRASLPSPPVSGGKFDLSTLTDLDEDLWPIVRMELREAIGEEKYSAFVNLLSPVPTRPQEASLQARVKPWMTECFGDEISADKLERGDRHLEEVLELLQSGDYPRERVAALTDYVYNRPKGEPSQEVGGVMITLAAYCLAHGLDMHDAGEVELARINRPEIIAKIRAKQAAKPTGSALPICLSAAIGEPRRAALEGET